MILSFINSCYVLREVLTAFLVFNTSLGTLRMLMNEKSYLIPLYMLHYFKWLVSMSHWYFIVRMFLWNKVFLLIVCMTTLITKEVVQNTWLKYDGSNRPSSGGIV